MLDPDRRFDLVGEKSKDNGGVWVYDEDEDSFVVKHRAISGSISELFQQVRRLTPGTASDPTRMTATAKLDNQQEKVQQYVGFAERYPSFYHDSIFFLDHRGTPRFATHRDGESEITEFPDLDMTVWREYAVEWTDEPRATLYIDGKRRVEHTTHVPTDTLLRFIEVVNVEDGPPASPATLRVKANAMFDGI